MQNDRTSLLMSTYKPQLAIIVNKAVRPITESADYYLESHIISEDGKILEGKPLLQETIQEMVDVFFDERKNAVSVKGLITENLLCYEPLPGGHYKMIWYRPAEIRVVHFAKQLKLPTTKVWVPAMIYMADRKQLSVYALKTNGRPKENTKVFRAPFYNVNDSGIVCLGNASVKKPKEKSYSAFMKYWEDLFWLSEFTHVNGDRTIKGDLNKTWKALIESKTKKKWNPNVFVAYKGATLKSLLK